MVGLVERGIVGSDQCLADEADDLLAWEGVLECLQKEVADHPLGLGSQHVEGVGMGEVGVAGALERQQPDLRPVAVGDDQIVVSGQRGQGLDCGQDVLLLDLGDRRLPPLEQGIAAQGDHDAHLSRPIVATMAALMVWSRFSAWSKTIEAGDSKTSSVTSRARRAPTCRGAADRSRCRCCGGPAGSA